MIHNEKPVVGRIGHVLLGVTDLVRAGEFYEHQVGLRKTAAFEGFVFFDTGSIVLGLSTSLAKHVQPIAGAVEIVFTVEDVGRAHEELKRCGIVFLDEPRQTTAKEWSAHFKDPDGHLLSIFGPHVASGST